MATAYDVFGPCVVKTNTGSAGARETLGVIERSFNIPFDKTLNPVRSSASGEPVDYQTMGEKLDLTVDVSAIDEAVLNKLRYRGSGGTTPGVAIPPGRLIGTNSEHFRLILAGAYGTPWRFYFATLLNARPKYGTEYTVMSCRFLCWQFVAGSATTAAGVTWFDRTDADG